MKYAIAILLGAVEARHHHHRHQYMQMSAGAPEEAVPAEVAGDEGAPATPEEAAKEAKEEVKEKKPTAADVIAEAKAVLVNKPLTPQEGQMAGARAWDAAEAKSVAKYDAIGKGIIADGYAARAAGKVAAAEAAVTAENKMVEVLTARQEVLAAQEKARQAAAFKAHKAHVLHVKEHYAGLEAKAAADLAAAHGEWKAKYAGQKRLPLDTPSETWAANMPEHVVDSKDFWIKAPAPAEKLIKAQEDAEKKAEDVANPPPAAKKTPAQEATAAAESEAAAAIDPAAAAAEPAPAAPAAFLQMRQRPQRLSQRDAEESSSASASSESSESASSGSDSE